MSKDSSWLVDIEGAAAITVMARLTENETTEPQLHHQLQSVKVPQPLPTDLCRRIQAFKTKCLRILLWIFYKEHETNDFVCSAFATLVGAPENTATIMWPRHGTLLKGYAEEGQCQGKHKNWWQTWRRQFAEWGICHTLHKEGPGGISSPLLHWILPCWWQVPMGWLHGWASLLYVRVVPVQGKMMIVMKPFETEIVISYIFAVMVKIFLSIFYFNHRG